MTAKKILTSIYSCLLLTVLLQISVVAQNSTTGKDEKPSDKPAQSQPDVKEAPRTAATDPGTTALPAAKPQQPAEGKFSRWLELQTATISTRYRFIENTAGVTTNNQLQHNEQFRARLKFDPKGDYSITAGVGSGFGMTSSWNNTGIGTGDAFTNLYLKHLYFAARPVKGLGIQYGGLYFVRGETTEITSYDNDAYMMGQRIAIKRPKQLYFDEISITFAHVGDFNKPSVTKRFNRLDESNYHQFLVSKQLSKRVAMSADYTFYNGAETLREAVKVGAKETKLFDTVRFETYQRMDVNPDWGFALSGEKAVHKRITLGGGFAKIDRSNGTLNGDRYGIGNRLFLTSNFTLSPEFTLQTFLTRDVANSYNVGNKTRFDLVLSYNLLKTLQKAGLF